MSKRKPKVGDIVKVDILDHASHEEGVKDYPLQFEVFGRLVDITDDVYVVASWIDPNGIDNNTEMYSLVRGAVTAIKVLR